MVLDVEEAGNAMLSMDSLLERSGLSSGRDKKDGDSLLMELEE